VANQFRMQQIARIASFDRLVSPVALGMMNFQTLAAVTPLIDGFWESGGNLFDTAWVYDDGLVEQHLGQWFKLNGTRADSVVIGKGAHTPFCDPASLAGQLTESLDRMQTDYVDTYLMHRDNPEVPVGEFVDAMDAEVRAGRIRGPFGGSNWTIERMNEAIAYAHANGRQAPSVLSNNVSLARMEGVIWDGCISASTEPWQQWLEATQTTNFAWSSQSRGFFTDRAGRDKTSDEELVRVWYSDVNFARRDRAAELAAELGCRTIHVALAYVIAQPYPSIPIMGPATVEELHDSLIGTTLALTEEQCAWLRNGEPA
jgi:aryl-alcohol dehydrogenase-like predicted oxidoreductase